MRARPGPNTSIPATTRRQDAAYHSVTAMVGAGVLGLPSTFISLGWPGGIITLVLSFWISWWAVVASLGSCRCHSAVVWRRARLHHAMHVAERDPRLQATSAGSVGQLQSCAGQPQQLGCR